jgi:hypothetical protein
VRLQRGEQRFELQDLEQGVTYPVSLVAFKSDRQSRTVSTTLSTGNVESSPGSDSAVEDKLWKGQGGASGYRVTEVLAREMKMGLWVQKKSIPTDRD